MGHTHPPPCATAVGQPAQQQPAETTHCFALAKHGFHNDLTSSGQCTACRRAPFRRQALLRRGWWGAHLGLRRLGPLALRGAVWVAPYTLPNASTAASLS